MNHALALPMFIIFWPSIRQSIQDFNDNPQMWGFLILNVVTQYVCVSGVHRLSSVSSSLTLNLVLSLRKVASLILSSIIFQNPFTWGHFCGVSLVTIGTLLYANKGKPAQDFSREFFFKMSFEKKRPAESQESHSASNKKVNVGETSSVSSHLQIPSASILKSSVKENNVFYRNFRWLPFKRKLFGDKCKNTRDSKMLPIMTVSFWRENTLH
jgi:hypothetical protein